VLKDTDVNGRLLPVFLSSKFQDASSSLCHYDVASVNDSRDPSQKSKDDVDQKISATSLLCQHSQRRENDSQDKLANICAG